MLTPRGMVPQLQMGKAHTGQHGPQNSGNLGRTNGGLLHLIGSDKLVNHTRDQEAEQINADALFSILMAKVFRITDLLRSVTATDSLMMSTLPATIPHFGK